MYLISQNKEVKKVDFLEKIDTLHNDAITILDKIKVEVSTISRLQSEQDTNKNLGLPTNPNKAFDMLERKRRVKILERSYNKILQKINAA